MSERTLVRIHLPVDASCVAEVMMAVGRTYPDAALVAAGDQVWLRADPDLTMEERRANLAARERATREKGGRL
jgi:hypothetical protein